MGQACRLEGGLASPRIRSRGCLDAVKLTEDARGHRRNFEPRGHFSRPALVEVDRISSPALLWCAEHPSAKQIAEGFILDRHDNLAADLSERRKDFDELQRPEVVDVLNGIVQHERLPTGPRPSKMD